MSRRRSAPRVSDDVIARLVIRRHGCKGLKDEDVALLLGVTLQSLYESIGSTLWLFSRSFMFRLTPPKRARRAELFPSSLAFTKAGVIAIAALLNNEYAFEMGIRIAHALKQRRRSSANRKHVRRRPGIDPRSPAYERAVERLQAQMKKILESSYPLS